MKQKVKKGSEKSGLKTIPDGKTIAIQLMDTAWRVALPILLFTLVGIHFDKRWQTAPVLALTGLFISLATATLLVYRQIKQLYPEFFRKGGK